VKRFDVEFDGPYPIHSLIFGMIEGRLHVSVSSDQSLGGSSTRTLSDLELDTLYDFVYEARHNREMRGSS
jgi:hypothetical protein